MGLLKSQPSNVASQIQGSRLSQPFQLHTLDENIGGHITLLHIYDNILWWSA